MYLYFWYVGFDSLNVFESSVAMWRYRRNLGSTAFNGWCCQVSMPNIINWHHNPLNRHLPASDCEYTHQGQWQKHEPHQLPAVGSRDLTATPSTPQGQVHQQACRDNYWEWWWIHIWGCLGCSWEVECCPKGYQTGTWDNNVLRTYGLTSTQSWLEVCFHRIEPFRWSPVGNGLSSHPSSKLKCPLFQAPMGPPQFQSWHYEHCLPSTNLHTSNRCRDEDVSIDVCNRSQDDNASVIISQRNHSRNVRFDIANGNQDEDAIFDCLNGNQDRDQSPNVRDRIANGRDAIDGVDAEVLGLAWAFQSLGTEEISEFVCIYTAI